MATSFQILQKLGFRVSGMVEEHNGSYQKEEVGYKKIGFSDHRASGQTVVIRTRGRIISLCV